MPNIDINNDEVHDLSGTDVVVAFELTFPGILPAGCPLTSSITWRIGADGQVTLPDGPAMLVDRPQGMAIQCSYFARPPVSVAGGALRLVSAGSIIVSANSGSSEVSYMSTKISFAPDIEIMVPDFDDAGDGSNDFMGATFEVGFTPTDPSIPGCSTNFSEVWVVAADGAVARQRSTSVMLVDRLANEDRRCSYSVEFPASAAGGDLVLDATGTVTVSAEAVSAAATYINAESLFSPEVTVMVPDFDDDGDGVNNYAGTDIVVSFAAVGGSDPGCAAVTQTWRISDGGAAVLSGGPAVLVDRPEGVTSRCSYDVVFPPSAAGGDLVRTSSGSVVVSAAAVSAAATYINAESMFSPEVTVTVPQTSDGGGVNLYAGVDIVVSFAAVNSSDPGCTAATQTWRINDGGTAVLSGGSAVLVDRPQGVTSRCSYNVVFPASAAGGDLVRTSSGAVVVSAEAVSAFCDLYQH